jgi:serine/threonine protein kinase
VKKLRNDDQEYLEVAKKEFKLVKDLDHPNIGKMYALFQNKKKATLYFVMEYCKGRTVMNYIEDEGPLPEDKAKKIFS